VILAAGDVLSSPGVQGGALGLLGLVITGAGAFARQYIKNLNDIIATRDTMISTLLAERATKDERVLTVLQEAAVAQSQLAGLGTRMVERETIADDRNRNRSGGR
jgi:hypothetical protein